MSNEQNISSYYAKPLNKRFIISLQKKFVILQLASIFLVRVFRNTLIPSVKMTLTMNQIFHVLYVKPFNERLIFLLKKKCYFGFYFLVRVSKAS